MKPIWLSLGVCALILVALFTQYRLGDAKIREFCLGLPTKLSQSEVRGLAAANGLSMVDLQNAEMRVSKSALGGLFERRLSCRIAFGRELTVEYRMLEGE